ncbi:MAG: DNA/RNA non-specific endonuclease [Streptococcaceae bacterium]|jgi:DNA-entry nuclease|nr:DNA/RNA non-specific endonuclease [Streptococcaceae bacterium]
MKKYQPLIKTIFFLMLTLILLLVPLSITKNGSIKHFLEEIIHVQPEEETHPAIEENKFANKQATSTIKQIPLTFTNKKQLVFEPLDELSRPTSVSVQVKFSEMLEEKPIAKPPINPVGYKNYYFYPSLDARAKNRAYLYQKQMLMPYEFHGIEYERRNLCTQTAYLYKGKMKGADIANDNSIIYYEKHLKQWMEDNPECRLDLQVTPLYVENELIPRQIRLSYKGFREDGSSIVISLNSKRESVGQLSTTVVYLDNFSPNARIDYLTGEAVMSFE